MRTWEIAMFRLRERHLYVRWDHAVYCIFTKAGSGSSNSEEAFWVICDPSGGYDCLLWPSTANQGSSSTSTAQLRKAGCPQTRVGSCTRTHGRRNRLPARASAAILTPPTNSECLFTALIQPAYGSMTLRQSRRPRSGQQIAQWSQSDRRKDKPCAGIK
jgi:hypothetical protein